MQFKARCSGCNMTILILGITRDQLSQFVHMTNVNADMMGPTKLCGILTELIEPSSQPCADCNQKSGTYYNFDRKIWICQGCY